MDSLRRQTETRNFGSISLLKKDVAAMQPPSVEQTPRLSGPNSAKTKPELIQETLPLINSSVSFTISNKIQKSEDLSKVDEYFKSTSRIKLPPIRAATVSVIKDDKNDFFGSGIKSILNKVRAQETSVAPILDKSQDPTYKAELINITEPLVTHVSPKVSSRVTNFIKEDSGGKNKLKILKKSTKKSAKSYSRKKDRHSSTSSYTESTESSDSDSSSSRYSKRSKSRRSRRKRRSNSHRHRSSHRNRSKSASGSRSRISSSADVSIAVKNQAAVNIQKLWRGFIARKRIVDILKTNNQVNYGI